MKPPLETIIAAVLADPEFQGLLTVESPQGEREIVDGRDIAVSIAISIQNAMDDLAAREATHVHDGVSNRLVQDNAHGKREIESCSCGATRTIRRTPANAFIYASMWVPPLDAPV